MRTLFKQLSFKRDKEFRDSIRKSRWEFYVPGVNSGVYLPATLHATVLIEENKAGFFNLTKSKSYADITLSESEFDELFAEMQKIKQLRDAKIDER